MLILDCKLVISHLRKRITVSSNVEHYICSGEKQRIKCQRVVNYLLVRLQENKDYRQFYLLLNDISVSTSVLSKLLSGTVH